MNDRPLRVVVHDYSGHPGQAQLSRALARRGYEVVHQHCPSYTTGKGSLECVAGDPDTLTFQECPMRKVFKRYSPLRRLVQELGYGVRIGRSMRAYRADVVVVSNIPLFAHRVLTRYLRKAAIPMVFWHQDIYSLGVGNAAKRRLPGLGRLVAAAAERIERTIARSSVAIVAISPVFLDKLSRWGVAEKTTVIPNWAPIDELPLRPRQNSWSDRMGLSSVPVCMYSGTLGLKHDPQNLIVIAEELAATDPDARMVVISEGLGRAWLERYQADHGVANMVLLDFQSYEDLPDVLASADVLVAILEHDASKYSVPSKVLTYLCSGRPVLGVMPSDNSVAEILASRSAGVVVEPDQRDHIRGAVRDLIENPHLRHKLGAAGRAYAESAFSPETAADRFELVFATLQMQAGRTISAPPKALAD